MRLGLLAGLILWTSAVLGSFAGGSSAATAQDQAGGDRPFVRLLAYAPQAGRAADAERLAYSNLADVKRLRGAAGTPRTGELPSSQSLDEAGWQDDLRQMPLSSFLGVDRSSNVEDTWRRVFGFALVDVDYELNIGHPPRWLSVIEGPINAQLIGRRLAEAGYVAAPSTLTAQAQLYARFEDYDYAQGQSDPIFRLVLANFNRVLVAPGLLIAAPASELVQEVVGAATGGRPSQATDPAVRLVATTMDDPALLPGTTLLGALVGTSRSLVGTSRSLLDAPVERVQELMQQQSEEPVLPEYRRLGIGFRRGAGAAERYLLFTLAYDEVSEARAAEGVLDDRIRRYRSGRTQQPLLGAQVAEVLPTVVREGPSGASVSLVLRPQQDPELSWLHLANSGDLGFLEPGQMRLKP